MLADVKNSIDDDGILPPASFYPLTTMTETILLNGMVTNGDLKEKLQQNFQNKFITPYFKEQVHRPHSNFNATHLKRTPESIQHLIELGSFITGSDTKSLKIYLLIADTRTDFSSHG